MGFEKFNGLGLFGYIRTRHVDHAQCTTNPNFMPSLSNVLLTRFGEIVAIELMLSKKFLQ